MNPIREAAAKAIYEYNLSTDSTGNVHPWVPGGNSLKQDEARQIADIAIYAALPLLQERFAQIAEDFDLGTPEGHAIGALLRRKRLMLR